MEEADLLSDRIGIIDKGKIIALDTPEQLKERIQQKEVIHLEISGWFEQLEKVIKEIPWIDHLIVKEGENSSLQQVSLQTANSRAAIPLLIDKVNVNGTHLVNMNILKPSLEDVFIHLTGKALRD